MSQENVDRVHRAYDAFNRRDLDAWGLHHRHTRLDHEALELVLLPRVDADTKDTDDLRRTTITSS
jgi:hypothetical protein